MAEILPIDRAIHYDLERVGKLDQVVAPPYDVIDAAGRAALLERSPENIVEIDLPEPPADDPDGDRYAHAAEVLDRWLGEGTMVHTSQPTIWALTQTYDGPGGERLTRHGFLCRVKLAPYGEGIRAHERTQPGPKEDRLRLTRATRCNLSPIFTLYEGDVWPTIASAIGDAEPTATVTDEDGTEHSVWMIRDSGLIEEVVEAVSGSEMLIADGHHRYETALTYRDERIEADGDAGGADWVMMVLVGLDDPGLTVFPTHRLVTDLSEADAAALPARLAEFFDLSETDPSDLAPGGADGVGVFGFTGAAGDKPMKLVLNQAGRDLIERALPDASAAYRNLDAAILETVVLGHLLGKSEDDIAAKRGLAYTPDTDRALAMVESGEAQAAFLLRPTPVESVQEIASAGEVMPPKSTYFFPKLLTGIALNPLD